MLNVCCVSTEVWMYGEVGDERLFLHIFKERLKDCFYQRWWAQISNSERFNLYHCFKSTLQCKRYLRCMQSLCTIQDGCVKDKLSPTTFLCCFRPTKLPLCTTSTEDECHMLLQCPAYTDWRTIFSLETRERTGSQKEQYIQILCSASDIIFLSLLKFFFCFAFAIKRRESLITA